MTTLQSTPTTTAAQRGVELDLISLTSVYSQLGGNPSTLHLAGSEAYDAAVMPWNVAVTRRPVAVVEALTSQDVVAAVRSANAHRLQVSVQATGHGAAGDLHGLLLVSTRRLTDIEIDVTASTARAGAGVTWSQVLEAGAPHGLAGLAGSAPGVGVVGYTTGGGVGPLARTHGLAADRVQAFEVVTGDGELRRATANDHPELFWGLRGGKGLLGIVTAIEFELLSIAEIYGGAVYFDGADAAAVLHRWAQWSSVLPREATTSVALLRLPAMPGVPVPLAGRLTVAIRFAFTGDPAEGARVLAPIRNVATPVIDMVAPMPYAALGAIHADPVDPMPTHEDHALLGSLSAETVDRLLEAAGPGVNSPQIIVELRQLGGAIADIPTSSSAYCARAAAFSLLTIGLGIPPVVEAVAADAQAVLEAVRPWATGSGLPNFAPAPGRVWLERTYDATTLTRLAHASQAYDPASTIAGSDDLLAVADDDEAAGHRGTSSGPIRRGEL